MGAAIYLLSSLVTALCAVQLLLAFRRSGQPLLLWSGLCFTAFTVTHFMVFVDLVLMPSVDLYAVRLGGAAIALALMLCGLVWGEV